MNMTLTGLGIHGPKARGMKISARNQIKGRIKTVRTGTIMAEVEVAIEAADLTALITRGSCREIKPTRRRRRDDYYQVDRGNGRQGMIRAAVLAVLPTLAPVTITVPIGGALVHPGVAP
jgi:molybdopterin-binding protein